MRQQVSCFQKFSHQLVLSTYLFSCHNIVVIYSELKKVLNFHIYPTIAFQIEPIVQKGNEALVHHIVVYECESNFNESHINTSGSCEDPAMPVHIKQCKGRNSVYAWAIGGKVSYYMTSHLLYI